MRRFLIGSTLLLTGTAGAQTNWMNPANGTWGTAGNWTAGVPTAAMDATLGHATAYDVTMSAAGTSQALTISNPLARLLVNSGVTYTVVGNITNSGTIIVNPSGGAADAAISFNSPAITLSGSGTIVLNPVGGGVSTDAGIVSSVATNIVTNAAGHTIRGNGYITANISNAGLITGDIAARGINLATNPKSNSGQIIAQNAGFVDLNGITLTQTGTGVFRASGANAIAEASGSIIGGAWEAVSGGLARTGGTLTLDSVTTNGDVHVISAQSMIVLNTLTNTGTITINPSGGAGDALISFNSPAITLNGGGTIVLNPVGGGVATDAGINTNAPANIVTNPLGATIRGNG